MGGRVAGRLPWVCGVPLQRPHAAAPADPLCMTQAAVPPGWALGLPSRPSFQATSVPWCFVPLSGPHSHILFPRKSLKALSLQMGKLTR